MAEYWPTVLEYADVFLTAVLTIGVVLAVWAGISVALKVS